MDKQSVKGPIRLEAGTHTLAFIVGNANGIPALRVEGETIFTDGSWLADAFEGEKSPVGSMKLSAESKPTDYQLPCTKIAFESMKVTESGIIYDFGRETYIKLIFDSHNQYRRPRRILRTWRKTVSHSPRQNQYL